MAYKNTIPAAGDIPSQSQSEILENFAQLETQIGTEHTLLTAAIGNGKHKFVTLVQNPAAPLPTGTEMVLTQEVGGTKTYLQVHNSTAGATGQWVLPMRRIINAAPVGAPAGLYNIYDFAASGLGAFHAGTIQVYDNTAFQRQVFACYVYAGGALTVSGAQMNGGSARFLGLTQAGSNLVLDAGAGVATTVHIIITESWV